MQNYLKVPCKELKWVAFVERIEKEERLMRGNNLLQTCTFENGNMIEKIVHNYDVRRFGNGEMQGIFVPDNVGSNIVGNEIIGERKSKFLCMTILGSSDGAIRVLSLNLEIFKNSCDWVLIVYDGDFEKHKRTIKEYNEKKSRSNLSNIRLISGGGGEG